MANFRTCHNCAVDRNECATRDKIKRAIAGLHITSIKFNCPDRDPLYRPGERVEVTWPVNDDAGHGDWQGSWNLETWPATVIQEANSKWLICVDDVDSDYETPARSYIKNGTLYCKVSAAKLKKLDEPRRNVCGLCGIVAGNGFNACWQEGTRPHRLCLRAITESASPTPTPNEVRS